LLITSAMSGVRVVDEAMREEGVEQRLDRGIRRARVEEVRAELVHHLLVDSSRMRAQLARCARSTAGTRAPIASSSSRCP